MKRLHVGSYLLLQDAAQWNMQSEKENGKDSIA